KKIFTSVLARPDASSTPEREVLESGLGGWIDHLRKEATRKASVHPLWQHVHQGFNTGLGDVIKDRFNDSFRGFQVSLADEVELTAKAIYEDLAKNPVALNAFRGTKFGLEVSAIVSSVTLAFFVPFAAPWIATVVLAPLSASVIQMLTEFFGK